MKLLDRFSFVCGCRTAAAPLLASCALGGIASAAGDAAASPEAHILRIDSRAGVGGATPLLTTVIEVVQFKRLSDVLQPCADASGAAMLRCWSMQLERPGALWDPFPFPESNAHLFVKVGGEDTLARFVGKTPWGKAQSEPNVGTAWLVAVDASSGMGGRLNDARAIAHELVESMQTGDLMDIVFFDDVQAVRDTKWKTFRQRTDLANALNGIKTPMPSHGSDRALFKVIKNMTQDAFGSLGHSDTPEQVPLHQAMVVLSSGAGRADPESASPSADVFHQYLDSGRFPPENTSLPKTPLPVIAVWFPDPNGLSGSISRNNEAQFMQSLANPEIGGFFDVVKEGEGTSKGKTIIGLVRARFNAMWLVHWELSCINPSVEQSFDLVFENAKPMIAPDGSFKEIALGIDPVQRPLDVDVKKTTDAAAQSPAYPGGPVTVYGNFCWSGDRTRAEAYFVAAGTKPKANGSDPAAARAAMLELQAEHMLGTAQATGDGYATFVVPDDDKVLEGSGDDMVVRLVVYDNKAHRASAIDDKSVLSLKATKKPWPWSLVGGVAGLAVVLGLLGMVLAPAATRKKRRGSAPPGVGGYEVAPIGNGPAAGGYVPPSGAGYGMQPTDNAFALAHAQGPGAPGPASPHGLFAMGAQPPPSPAYAGPAVDAEPFGPTAAMPVAAGVSAILRGETGQHTIVAGSEVRVGRDPTQCPIFLSEPRVSGIHASLKLEAGTLMVRDETSNNGTWLAGTRIAPGTWIAVPPGALLRFGPVEFSVQLQG